MNDRYIEGSISDANDISKVVLAMQMIYRG